MTRDKIVALRLSDREKSLIEAYAKKKHTNVAAMVRQIVMDEVESNG